MKTKRGERRRLPVSQRVRTQSYHRKDSDRLGKFLIQCTIYRKKGKKTFSIPLSCIRNWASPKDTPEELFYQGKIKITPKDLREHPESFSPKYLRNFPAGFGINVSRALGDRGFNNLKQKPKVTGPIQLLPDDEIVLASDGVWDFVKEESLVEKVITPFLQSYSLAQEVVRYAHSTGKSNDNLSALVITVSTAKDT